MTRKFSAEHRRKISEAGKGRIPWNKGGGVYSAEMRRNMSEANRNASEEIKRRRNEARKHSKKFQEHTSRMGKANKGRKPSEESKRKKIETWKAKYMSYEEAKEYVHPFGFKSQHAYKKWHASVKPDRLPKKPEVVYEGRGWISWPDFFGRKKKAIVPLDEAKKRVRSAGIKSWPQYWKWRHNSGQESEMPARPPNAYRNKGWISAYDFFGTKEEECWTASKIQELLRAWIDSGLINQADDTALYDLLRVNRLLNIPMTNKNRSRIEFFKNFIPAVRINEGLETIKKLAYSPPLKGVKQLPDLSKIVQKAQEEELQKLADNHASPLTHDRLKTPEELLKESEVVESFSADEEKIRFHVNKYIKAIWADAFVAPEATYLTVKAQPRTDNKFRDEIRDTFLWEYEQAMALQIPEGYSFTDPKTGKISPPTMMQRYVMLKVKQRRRFGNFSGTGAGKTLSALLSSRVIDSKLTVIICPHGVVKQWGGKGGKDDGEIKKTFPDSLVYTTKAAFYEKYDENRHKYLVLHYDLFNQGDSEKLVDELLTQRVDFVILDEVHFTKRRDKIESQRRHNIGALMTGINRKNPDVYVLALSATPVINDLEEGKSVLQLITGESYDNLETNNRYLHNAVTLHTYLSNNSIREKPPYPKIKPDEIIVKLDAYRYEEEIRKLNVVKANPLQIERLTIDSKIPEMLKCIEGKGRTLIFTYYVTGIIPKITKALKEKGYSYAVHTGKDHSGKDKFLNNKIDVLVASQPIATGVDGLQHICNNLVIVSLPWTNAAYEQLVGRIIRKGNQNDADVKIYVIKAKFVDSATNGEFFYDGNKWRMILNKRTLQDCAVDGIMPSTAVIPTPYQATREVMKWLQRVIEGKITYIQRAPLEVELNSSDALVSLPPIQTASAAGVVKKPPSYEYNDFSLMTQEMNTERSETTHQRFIDHPEQWHEYHRLRAIAEQEDLIIPRDIIKDILNQSSKNWVIADFGCGEAQLAKELGTDRVKHSFDHLAKEEDKHLVKQCDMKDTGLNNECIDVAVFSLSMKGKNWRDYVVEAYRCLYHRAIIIIADTTNSINKEEGRLYALRDELKAHNFEIYSDRQIGKFTFIEARKL